ncbi:MAG: hypothetical protein J5789_06090 [Oscillospiraceae bacterium]|nr:hypothetical protein [Oscillospiraceae bacterium]
MEPLLIRERYKIVRMIGRQPDYALLEAVDIFDRETSSRLINLYEGAHLRRYARLCSEINTEECPDFCGMFLEQGALAAVFDLAVGEPIDRLFYRGDVWSWQDRLRYAELILNLALSMANLPPELSCAALCSDNILIDINAHRAGIRWMLRPMEEMKQRETALMAADQVRKILPPTLRAGKEERKFLDELEAGAFHSVVALYGRWREAEQAIRREREEFDSLNFLRRGFILCGRAIHCGGRRGEG